MEKKQSIKPYKDHSGSKKEQVEEMFDNISDNYDGLNRIISMGIDQKWRKKVIDQITAKKPERYLDIATGTGDLALQFAARLPNTKIVGLDLSEGMLTVARKKITGTPLETQIDFIKGDSEALPFEDNSFEAITVSFGIRNFQNLEKGLSEILRVLAPNGLFIILETSVPTKFPFKQGYGIYAKAILPLIGKLFSKDKVAYRYLSESASVFPFGSALNNILQKTGFKEVQHKPQTLGVATIYSATK